MTRRAYIVEAMADTLRIGVLGLGLHGSRYTRHLQNGDVPGATLSAVWRRDNDKGRATAQTLGVRFIPGMMDLIDDEEVDAIVAAVPAGLHPAIAARVAEQKKPFLCEKPLACTAREAATIVDLFDRAGVPLTVAQTLRFDPLVAALAQRLPTLGGLTGFCLEQRIEPRGLGWEDVPELSGGGTLIQTGIHTLDALRVITRPRRVQIVHAMLDRHVYQHVEDHALLSVALHGAETSKLPRVIGHVASSKIGGSRHMRFAFYAEHGGLEADFIGRTLTTVAHRDQQVETFPEEPTVVRVLTAFVRFVREGAPNPVPGAEGLLAVRAVEDAYQFTGGSSS